jgi:thioredoxin 1
MKLLKFYADWCQPCKMLSNVIEDCKADIEGLMVTIEEVDIDNNMELAKQYNVRGVPTLIMVEDSGEEVRRKSGYMMANDVIRFVEGRE